MPTGVVVFLQGGEVLTDKSRCQIFQLGIDTTPEFLSFSKT